jgi:adenosylcobinamide-phosphate synthase
LTPLGGAPIVSVMFLHGLYNQPGGFDALILLVVALAIEAVVGEMRFVYRWLPHPVKIIGAWTGWLDAKLNRETRGETVRAMRGAVAVLVVVIAAGAVGWGVAWLSQTVKAAWALELFLLVSLIAQRELYARVRAVGVALRDRGLAEAQAEVAHIVGRDPARLDDYGVARAAIESCAENYGDGVVAPVFWYVLFGFPGILVYKAVNTMDSMIGYRTPKHAAFGATAARLDDVLNIIPARLAGLFIVLAGVFVPTANPSKALRVMWRDAEKHRSMNAGWPEGAMAGALGLSLGGPRIYAEGTVADSWIGDGRARATHRDIRRALYVFTVACLINGIIVAALAVIRLS